MALQSPLVRVGIAAVVKDAEGRMVMGIRKASHGLGMTPVFSLYLGGVHPAFSLFILCR